MQKIVIVGLIILLGACSKHKSSNSSNSTNISTAAATTNATEEPLVLNTDFKKEKEVTIIASKLVDSLGRIEISGKDAEELYKSMDVATVQYPATELSLASTVKYGRNIECYEKSVKDTAEHTYVCEYYFDSNSGDAKIRNASISPANSTTAISRTNNFFGDAFQRDLNIQVNPEIIVIRGKAAQLLNESLDEKYILAELRDVASKLGTKPRKLSANLTCHQPAAEEYLCVLGYNSSRGAILKFDIEGTKKTLKEMLEADSKR